MLLTRVHNAKFLVVADINTLKEAKMTTLMSHYDEPLSQLLGRKYEDGIDHLYFILTKNSPVGDPNRMTEADVERLAFQGAKDFHKTQRTGTQFLYRLSDRFIIVDMEQDNNVTLLNKIQVMIEQDEAEKQNRSAITSFVIDKLQDGEGKLHMKCSARVAELGHEQEEIIKSFTSLRTAVEDARDTILADTQRHKETHRDLLVQEHDTKEELSKVRSKIEQYTPIKERLQKDLAERKEMLQVQTRQCTVFRESFEARDFINFRCDMSDYRRANFGSNGDHYKIHLNADVTSDGSEDRTILVLEYEEDDKSLKNHIGEGGSLLPKSLDVVKTMSGASVLYNSHTHVNKIGAAIGPGDHVGVLSLSIKSRKPFKVYIYSSRPFKSLDYFELLVRQFDQQKTDTSKRIEGLKNELDALDAFHRECLDAEKALIPKVTALELEITHSKQVLSAAIDNHEYICAEMSKKLDAVATTTKALKGKDEVAKISKIDRIFRSNSIQTALSEPLMRFNNGFGRIDRTLAELMDCLRVTRQEDRKELEGVIGMTIESRAEV
jgi:hypothetical protein